MPSMTQSSLALRVMRRVLHTYWRFARGMTLGVRAAVIDGENRVFLIRHTYVPGWYLPGGGVETGEPILEALERELVEEACIVLTGSPQLHGVFFNHQASPRDHVALYVVREFAVTGPKLPDREIAEAGFFPIDHLPEGVTKATRKRLAEIVHGEPISARW
ncbi:NUDIX domain-containing protein [Microvirga rosea]|uniref:NUDIX domain-containing protein n=1 Tax=Microvirga rosea TaxID=2715425 RepID=UPI001D0BC706|nr:NUDIX domain-containing protein [Microvirga rosea]MCB8821624.1 NUDIX domain-containing protein [Microvirga rosea]